MKAALPAPAPAPVSTLASPSVRIALPLVVTVVAIFFVSAPSFDTIKRPFMRTLCMSKSDIYGKCAMPVRAQSPGEDGYPTIGAHVVNRAFPERFSVQPDWLSPYDTPHARACGQKRKGSHGRS